MMKLYISYYGDYLSIVEGEYKPKKDNYYINKVEFFSIDDIEEGYEKEKYGLLRYALENMSFKSKHVVFCLNTRDIILKPHRLPKVNKKDLEGIMNLEVDEMMSLDREEYIFSYEVSKEFIEDNMESIDVIIGAIRKEEIYSIVDVLHDFNLNIDRIDTLATAYLRVLKDLDYNDIMVANIGDNSTIINIYKKGCLFIHDNIPIKVTAENMETQLINVVEESKGLMNYYSSRNFGKTTDRILILGKRHHNKSVYEAFSTTFATYISQGITEITDLDDMVSGNIDDNDINLIVENLGSMIEPNSRKNYDNINLLPEDIRKKQIKSQHIKRIAKLVPVVAIVMALPYIGLWGLNKSSKDKLMKIENEISNIEETYQEIRDIEERINVKKSEIDIYDMLINKKVKWGEILTAIDKNIPYRAELVSVSASYKEESTKEEDKSSDTTKNIIEDTVEELKGDSKSEENTEEPLYNKIPDTLELEGKAKDPAHVGQFVYKLKTLPYFDKAELHSVDEDKDEEEIGYIFRMTLYLKEGVLTNE